jgi:hypothetical protein
VIGKTHFKTTIHDPYASHPESAISLDTARDLPGRGLTLVGWGGEPEPGAAARFDGRRTSAATGRSARSH